jgi:hypothetical protein
VSAILCDHGYGLMRDSCPGCDHMEETPHVATVVTVTPSWSTRPHRRCTACSMTASHRIHQTKEQR